MMATMRKGVYDAEGCALLLRLSPGPTGLPREDQLPRWRANLAAEPTIRYRREGPLQGVPEGLLTLTAASARTRVAISDHSARVRGVGTGGSNPPAPPAILGWPATSTASWRLGRRPQQPSMARGGTIAVGWFASIEIRTTIPHERDAMSSKGSDIEVDAREAELAWEDWRAVPHQNCLPSWRDWGSGLYLRVCPVGNLCNHCGEPIGTKEPGHQHRWENVDLTFRQGTHPHGPWVHIHSERCEKRR